MKLNEFQAKLKQSTKPVIVDFWAPWCAPCRAMEPSFKEISGKYAGDVFVLKLNADDSPDVLKSLGVMGIPTVIAFAQGKEIMRRTGMQSTAMLDMLFTAAIQQRKPDIIPPTPQGRLFRSFLGLAAVIAGWTIAGHSIPLIVAGGVLIFSAFYDRCPIFKMVFPRLTALFRRSN